MPPPRMWVTKTQAAELCDLKPRQFSDAIQAKLSKDAMRGRGAGLRIHAPSAVKVLVEYRVEQAKPLPDETDPLMSGADSPGLERYRMANAQIKERELAQLDRELVRSSVIREMVRPGIAAMRAVGDAIVRRFGNDAGDMYNEGVNEFEATMLKAAESLKQ